jgi:hypothetical protein
LGLGIVDELLHFRGAGELHGSELFDGRGLWGDGSLVESVEVVPPVDFSGEPGFRLFRQKENNYKTINSIKRLLLNVLQVQIYLSRIVVDNGRNRVTRDLDVGREYKRFEYADGGIGCPRHPVCARLVSVEHRNLSR